MELAGALVGLGVGRRHDDVRECVLMLNLLPLCAHLYSPDRDVIEHLTQARWDCLDVTQLRVARDRCRHRLEHGTHSRSGISTPEHSVRLRSLHVFEMLEQES